MFLKGTPSITKIGVSPRNVKVGSATNSVLLRTIKPATLPVSDVAMSIPFTV